MKKVIFNIDNDYKDFIVYKDFVVYKDKDNDIVIVNDIKNKEYTLKKDIVFNNIVIFKDNDIDFVFDFDFDFKVIYDNDNDIDIDNDNVFKYVNDIKIINDNDIKDIIKIINDNDFVKVLINNDKVFDKDFDKDKKDFVLISLNKDIYYKNEYQLKDYIRLSYIIFDFDSDNIKVIIDSNNLNYFLSNLNYIYKDLKNNKSKDFIKSQLIKKDLLFNNLQYEYFKQFKFKPKTIRQQQKKDYNLKRLINKGNNTKKQIKTLEKKLLKSFIKCHYSIYKQYIINNDCYYNDLNDLKDIVYKSFKNIDFDNDFKEKIYNIDKNNVNSNYKYKDKVNDNNNDNDNVFDFDFDIDNDFDFNITYSYDNDLFKDFVNDYRKNINKVLKDISYNLSDNKITFKNIINDIDFDIIDFKEKIIKNNDNDLLEKQINFLSQLKDFLIDFEYNKSYDNDNDSYFDNDNDLYHFDIFKSDMNKHNSIIKNISQSDFYHIAYNEKLNDFITID